MDSAIKTINFNQDFTCLSVGSATDYKVYNCDPFGECFHKNDDGGASIVEMLFSTSLIAIVGLGDKPSTSTRRLKIINTKRKTIICELTFPTSVLSVKLNRKRLIVVLYDQIYIYDVSCMKLLHTIETVPNKLAAVSLSSDDNSILCFPSSSLSMNNVSTLELSSQLSNAESQHQHQLQQQQQQHHDNASHQQHQTRKLVTGSVVVFDALNIQPINIIQVHKSSLATITLSKDGSLIATASSKGTIIRVFETSTGRRLFEFRRGSYGTTIQSLNFNHENTLLCCSSGTGTIHIFKLSDDPTSIRNAIRDETGTAASPLEASSSNDDDREERLVPRQVSEEEENTEELNQILNIDKSRSQGGKRSSSLSDYIWSTSSNITKNVKGQLNNYLPTKVQSILEPKRDFAFIKLPFNYQQKHLKHDDDDYSQKTTTAASTSLSSATNSGVTAESAAPSSSSDNIKILVGINSNNNNNVMCADSHGNFYVYNIPMDRGGECILVKHFSFKEMSS